MPRALQRIHIDTYIPAIETHSVFVDVVSLALPVAFLFDFSMCVGPRRGALGMQYCQRASPHITLCHDALLRCCITTVLVTLTAPIDWSKSLPSWLSAPLFMPLPLARLRSSELVSWSSVSCKRSPLRCSVAHSLTPDVQYTVWRIPHFTSCVCLSTNRPLSGWFMS